MSRRSARTAAAACCGGHPAGLERLEGKRRVGAGAGEARRLAELAHEEPGARLVHVARGGSGRSRGRSPRRGWPSTSRPGRPRAPPELSSATARPAASSPGRAAGSRGPSSKAAAFATSFLRLVGLAEDERALRLGERGAHVGRRLPGLLGSCRSSPRESQADGGRCRDDERPKRHSATARSSPRARRPPARPGRRSRSRAPVPRCRAPRPARA